MHIALYSPVLPATGSANGIVTYARIMQAAMRDIGHRVTVFDNHGIEHDDGRVEVVAPDRRWSTRLRARLRAGNPSRRPTGFTPVLDRLVRRERVDVVEMEESFGWVGRLRLDIPVVARLHGPHFLGKDMIEPPAEARISAERIAAEGRGIAAVRGVTSPSAKLMEATLAHYRARPLHARTIANPMPLSPSDERWSIDRCDPDQLLFVGRFDLRKGADVAIDAFGLAAARNPGLRLVMCGPDTGLLQPSGERVHYEAYAAERLPAALRERVRFLGTVSPAEIGRLRLESGLCLSTSRFETFHYSLAEALSVGAPVLASDTFGMTELLRDGVDGFIAPVGDADTVARAIGAAVADRRRLAEVGAAGLARCAALLSPRLIAEQTIDFYRSLG